MRRDIAALEATRLASLLNAEHLWHATAGNQALLEEAWQQVQEAHTQIAEWIRDFGIGRDSSYDAWLHNEHNWRDAIRDVNEVRARHGMSAIRRRE